MLALNKAPNLFAILCPAKKSSEFSFNVSSDITYEPSTSYVAGTRNGAGLGLGFVILS